MEQAWVLKRASGKIVGQIYCDEKPTAKHNGGVRFDRAIAVERHGDVRFETLDEETGKWAAIPGERLRHEKREERRQRLANKPREQFLDDDVAAMLAPLIARIEALEAALAKQP